MTRRLVPPILLALLAAAVLRAGEPEPLRVEATAPGTGAPWEGLPTLRLELRGGPGTPLTVLVKGFEVTHHLHVEEREPVGGRVPPVTLEDAFLPVRPGRHELLVSVWSKESPESLLETKLVVEVKEPEIPDEEADDEALDAVRSEISRATSERRGAERDYRLAAQGGFRHGEEKALADLHAGRVKALRRLVAAYAKLATVYDERYQTARARRALRYAREIWEEEAERPGSREPYPDTPGTEIAKVLSEPRPWLEALGRHLLRRGDLEGALSTLEALASDWEKQLGREDLEPEDRHRAREGAVATWKLMARARVLLRNDLEGREACLERARSLARSDDEGR
jgi:hypothetical protein